MNLYTSTVYQPISLKSLKINKLFTRLLALKCTDKEPGVALLDGAIKQSTTKSRLHVTPP